MSRISVAVQSLAPVDCRCEALPRSSHNVVQHSDVIFRTSRCGQCVNAFECFLFCGCLFLDRFTTQTNIATQAIRFARVHRLFTLPSSVHRRWFESSPLLPKRSIADMMGGRQSYDGAVVMGDESIMSKKAHGTCPKPCQKVPGVYRWCRESCGVGRGAGAVSYLGDQYVDVRW